MHEINSQFILLKIPPHVVRLLGKIHALSIEVLLTVKPYREKTCLTPYAPKAQQTGLRPTYSETSEDRFSCDVAHLSAGI